MEREKQGKESPRHSSSSSEREKEQPPTREPGAPASEALGNQTMQAMLRPGRDAKSSHPASSPTDKVTRELGRGAPLDGRIASQAGAAYGDSFADVQVHTDATAARLASELGADAFTVGNHVAFGASRYRPGTAAGDALLAHELAHVAQQRGGGDRVETPASGGRAYEQDADRAAVGLMARMYGGGMSAAAALGAKAMPALKSGVRLSLGSCFKSDKEVDKPPASALQNVGDPAASPSYEDWMSSFPTYYMPGVDEMNNDQELGTSSQVPTDLQGYISGASTGVKPDCADVSILLRHYWLKAHKQTSEIRVDKTTKYKIGDGVSDTEVGKVLNNVGTINFQEERKKYALVDWYKKKGNRITNLKDLIAAGLKPGDMFVWGKLSTVQNAPYFNGHAQTIAKVNMVDQAIEFLQGNMSQAQPMGVLELRRRTFLELTGAADGNADMLPTKEEYFFGAGPWKP